jgi:RNA polymerase sigma-70 factor (ECF subfamily)
MEALDVDVPTDAELLKAARTDAGAFRQLYDRYAEAIHRFHRGRTQQHDAALDLTAETFAQAWLARGRFRDLAGGSARPWLYAIARHVLVGSVRKGQLERGARDRLGIRLEVDRLAAPADPEPLWLEGLDDALAALDPDVRRLIELRIVGELDYREIAMATGTTPGAARVRVHRGLRALRSRLLQTKEALR